MTGGNGVTEIESIIKRFILTNFLPGESAANLSDDIPLRKSGILDSMAILKLITYVEREFGIEVGPTEADDDNFGTIRSIVALVERKLQLTMARCISENRGI